ncbi:MAG: riboflavin synthase [Candidatus Caenarcaniphilales bacterium]|nr:riboflavin synthase [Candidatus Caenarcaniphilales bacterium]
MFTGIIQEVGQVYKVQKISSELRFEVDLKSLNTKNLEIGESIAINGSCHTLESIKGGVGGFFSSKETLEKTNLRFLKTGDLLNLELSLTPNTRMGGHFVSGHIDGLAKLISIQEVKESYILHFEVQSQFSKYIINKGSVCLNGISLTVAQTERQSNVFSVAVIPHTWKCTNLQFSKVNDLFNFEADMLAKYIENFNYGKSSYSQGNLESLSGNTG